MSTLTPVPGSTTPETLNVLGLIFRIDVVDQPHRGMRCCWSVEEERIVICSAVPEADRPELLRLAAKLIAAELSFGPADTGGCVLMTKPA